MKVSPHRSNLSSAQIGIVQAFAQLRVKFFFDPDGTGHCGASGQTVSTYQQGNTVSCTEKDVLTPMMKDYILNSLMSGAVNYFQQALRVQPVVGNLVVSGSSCSVSIPQSHQTTGVPDADFIAYVTAVPLAASANSATVAWATTCTTDVSGRPIVGHINFVPQALGNNVLRKSHIQTLDVNTAIHELTHALGFSAPFFPNGYVDLNGVRQTGGTIRRQVRGKDLPGGSQATHFVSPRIVNVGKAFFGCSTLDAVEIEDQGGSGTSGSHWEKRILYLEYMAGVMSTATTYLSSFTLAYFEDTGFYQANYAVAQDDMIFGKGKGCNFISQKCDVLGASNGFCFDEDDSHLYCSPDFRGIGSCKIGAYGSSLPSAMQYFSDPKKGGVVEVVDYCPTPIGYSNLVCIDSTSSDSQDIYGNTYGKYSRCFQSNVAKSGYSTNDIQYEARCFPVTCSSTGSIIIDIQGQTALCPTDGSAGNADMGGVSGFSGSIACPKADAFCKDPNAATVSPSPASPTPAPTPAPPGQTPAPAPVVRPPAEEFELGKTCAERTTCANQITTRPPVCRLLAQQLLSCFGTTCDGAMAEWLVAKNATCTSSFEWGKSHCIEGPAGGAAMCRLLNRK